MAVYTQLTNEAIAGLIETHYALGTLAFAVGIAQGVENTNYLIAVEDAHGVERKYILTLYEKRTDTAELPFFLGLMQHLAARGVNCPQPIVRRDGAVLSEIAGRKAALVSFLQGKSRSVLRNVHAAQVGETLAVLHRAAEDFSGSRANRLSLAGWQALYAPMAARLDGIQPGLGELVERELAFLQCHWPPETELPRGIIHADLFPDNVFFSGDTVSGVIDFYFACSDFLAYDLAVTVNAWCFEQGRECNITRLRQMIKYYNRGRPLSPPEKQVFPVLLRGAAMRFLLTRAHDWLHHTPGALVTPKDPLEYAARLRFHQQAGAELYGM